VKFLHCPICIDEGRSKGYAVAVSPEGDLHIICETHKLNHAGAFYIFKNDRIALELLAMGTTPCEHCGESHGGGGH